MSDAYALFEGPTLRGARALRRIRRKQRILDRPKPRRSPWLDRLMHRRAGYGSAGWTAKSVY